MTMTYDDDIRAAADEQLPWDRIEGKNVLVTGATGLIGGCIVEVLMTHGNIHVYAAVRDETRAHARFGDYSRSPFFHFIRYDVSRPLSADTTFHYIIHAASGASPAAFATTPVEVIKANIYGTANLLEYGIHHGMQRLLYISSGEVYGEGGATEDTPLGKAFTETDSGYVNCASLRACYPSSKRTAETLCMAYGDEYDADTIIARPCHVYGPGFTPSDNRVYAQFIRNVLRGEDIIMKSDGSQFRSWCYVVDCTRALLYVMLKGKRGEAYNIADPSSNVSIRQLAMMIASAAGKKVVIQLPDDSESKGYNVVSKSIFSTAKVEALGWQIHGKMSEKLSKTVAKAHFSKEKG